MSKTISHLGDCSDVLDSLEDNTVDLLLQDLPYGVTCNEWDLPVDLQKMWPKWLRVCKSNAAMIFTAQQPFATDLIQSNRKDFRYDLIWYKALGTGFLNANRMPLRNHEHILVFYRQLPTYNPQKYKGRMRQKGGKNRQSSNYGSFKDNFDLNDLYHPQSVIDITNGDNSKNTGHPTEKPLSLLRYLIRTYSNIEDTVFDGYSGSGTTPCAAYLEKRNCIAVEKIEKYYKMGQGRYNALLADSPLFSHLQP